MHTSAGLPALSFDPKRRIFVRVFPDGYAAPYIAGAAETATLDQLMEQRDALLAEVENPSPDTDLEDLERRVNDVLSNIESARAATQRATEMRQRLMGAGTTTRTVTRPAAAPAGDEDPQPVDYAERFTQTEALINFRANGAKGRFAVDVPELSVRALIDNSATSGGAFQNPARPNVNPATNADRVPRVVDLLDRQTTGDNTVEYVRDTTAAGAGSAAEVAEGAAKPESTYTFEVVTDSVRTVAHWVNITRQTADDNQQLMGYIRGRLTYGLQYRLDGQVLNGNGTSPNLRGILNTTGINTYAPAAAEARVISIRKAITLVQQDEYAATGVVLNPSDWELVELSTDSNGMFRVNPNVANALGSRIWGLAVVATTAIAAGTGLVGDFRMGATLWDRQQAQIHITDSHASNFTSNILTLLAELRAALSVWRPAAFCSITFNGTI